MSTASVFTVYGKCSIDLKKSLHLPTCIMHFLKVKKQERINELQKEVELRLQHETSATEKYKVRTYIGIRDLSGT